MNESCVFCKIQAGIIPSKKVVENEHVFVIQDIAPKAPIHYLIIPKKHIVDVTCFEQEDSDIMSAMMLMAKQLSKIDERAHSFKLQINTGVAVGQSVLHVHFHFLAGKANWHEWKV